MQCFNIWWDGYLPIFLFVFQNILICWLDFLIRMLKSFIHFQRAPAISHYQVLKTVTQHFYGNCATMQQAMTSKLVLNVETFFIHLFLILTFHKSLVPFTYGYIEKYSKTYWLKATTITYYLSRFLWVMNSGVAWLGGTGSESLGF